MAKKYERVQMLLEPGQRRSLEDIARRKGMSIAEATRQAIELGLEVIQKEDVSVRWQTFFKKIDELHKEMPMLAVDPVEDLRLLREERDDRTP